MITVSECIRIYNLNTVPAILLNYMHVAKAAQYCEAYFTSIMYSELWALQIEAKSKYTLAQIKMDPNLQEIMKKVSLIPVTKKMFQFIVSINLLLRPTFPLATWMLFHHFSIQ